MKDLSSLCLSTQLTNQSDKEMCDSQSVCFRVLLLTAGQQTAHGLDAEYPLCSFSATGAETVRAG